MHKLLKSCWHITEPKGHAVTSEKPQITYCEGGVLLQHLFHLYLPEPWFEVQAGKMSSTYQTLQCLLYSGQRVGVLFHVSVQAAKSMQNCRSPSFFLTNTTALHQALWLDQIAPDSNISHRWFETSLTNGGGIHQNWSLKGVSSITFYHVFHGVGTAQLHWIQWEHIMVFSQEPAGSICQLRGPRVQATQI